MVNLIGCGPGDPELLTLKGKRLIMEADVIVYDDLIPNSLLALNSCEKIYVGKRAGRDYMQQPEINKLLVELAHEYKSVARLKGGDPCIFGRGGEEALHLKEHGIKFSLVPGISSAIAGPISAGIPPTHRGLAASVKFVTAHEDPTKKSGFLDWSLLAQESGTLIFLMGAGRIASIAEKLMSEGMDPETPMAFVQNATLPNQHRIISSLERAAADAANVASPCIIVVGQVASLELLSEISQPLMGRSILLTRPAHFQGRSAALFNAAGASVESFPLVEIAPLEFELPDFSKQDIFIFTSQNAVSLFMDKLLNSGLDARAFGGKEIYCIGPKTREVLRSYGLIVDGMAAEFRAEGIVEMLKDRDLNGKRVCLPRAVSARKFLNEKLHEMGAEISEIFTYATALPAKAQRDEFRDKIERVDTVIFTSPSGARHAAELLGDIKPLKDKALIAIGPVTAREMDKLGLPAMISASEYTDEGIIEALMKGANN